MGDTVSDTNNIKAYEGNYNSVIIIPIAKLELADNNVEIM
ncbi:hypothetical protein FDUTEX481_09102 [Tolypothrix sp. PCC 7601]|nr:hypothetical protein FDUTEX481_09102 [Tolypothrix sp. PCC 7601]